MSLDRRKVTIDSNVIISYSIARHDETLDRRAVKKCIASDTPMITNIITKECLRYALKSKGKISKSEMKRKLKEISKDIIVIDNIPPDEELEKRYKIRSKKDLKILYSADVTDSEIIISKDDDFFDDVQGIKAKIKKPKEYLIDNP